jgi:hypothetical protein
MVIKSLLDKSPVWLLVTFRCRRSTSGMIYLATNNLGYNLAIIYLINLLLLQDSIRSCFIRDPEEYTDFALRRQKKVMALVFL